jgi:hypothetical protein
MFFPGRPPSLCNRSCGGSSTEALPGRVAAVQCPRPADRITLDPVTRFERGLIVAIAAANRGRHPLGGTPIGANGSVL